MESASSVSGGGGGGGGGGPPAPPRGRARGPITREEAHRLREEEMASQAQGKDCFIIPQANLDRFLPDGVTVSNSWCLVRKQLSYLVQGTLGLVRTRMAYLPSDTSTVKCCFSAITSDRFFCLLCLSCFKKNGQIILSKL